jgi:hypothetical protein
MQASLAAAKQDLETARGELTALATKLQKAGLMSADEARKLEEKAKALEAREAALPANANPSSTSAITRDELEAMLLAHELRLRTMMSVSTPAEPSTTSKSSLTAAEVEELLREAARQREAKGLHLSDIPNGAELETLATSLLRANKTNEAAAKARALAQAADAITIDMGFVQRKFSRCNARVASLDPAARKRANTLLGEATERVAAGDLVGASARLTAVLTLADR